MDERMYKQLHYDLWNWLANNPGKEKDDWPGWAMIKKNYGRVANLCFACEYFEECELCPLNRSTRHGPECTLYYKWRDLNEKYITAYYLRFQGRIGSKNKTTKKLDNLATKTANAAIAVRDEWK